MTQTVEPVPKLGLAELDPAALPHLEVIVRNAKHDIIASQADTAYVFAWLAIFKRSQRLREYMDRMSLKIPVIGQILHQSAIARFARTLALTFKAGVPLVEALDITSDATGSIVYGQAIKKIRDDVSVGYQLNMAMTQVALFPHMVVQMAAIGEEAGALDTMLFKLAEFYEQEVNNAVDALARLHARGRGEGRRIADEVERLVEACARVLGDSHLDEVHAVGLVVERCLAD